MEVEEDDSTRQINNSSKPQTEVFNKEKEDKTRPRMGKGSVWKENVKCFVQNCSSHTASNPNLWFHKVPLLSTDPHLRHMWLKQIGQTELEIPPLCLICEKHYDRRDFNIYKSQIKSLKRTAFPTLLLPQKPDMPPSRSKPKHVYQRTVTDATKLQIINVVGNAHENSKSNLCNEQVNYADIKPVMETNAQLKGTQENSIDTFSEDQDSNDVEMKPVTEKTNQECHVSYYAKSSISVSPNETLNSLNNLYLRLKPERKGSNYKDSEEYKIKVFQLYHENREAYELLQKVFDLPPVNILPGYGPSTLKKINELYMSSLTEKVKFMPQAHRYGLLCINLMKIQPEIVYDAKTDTVSGAWLGSKSAPLQYAMITMVRGMVKDWHHIVSIKLLPSQNMCPEFASFLEKEVTQLWLIGLNIKAVVTTTDEIFKTHTVAKSKSYVMIKNQKIHHIFNPAHLRLLLYEELNQYKYLYSQKNSVIRTIIARWEDLAQYHECDTKSNYRITDQSHIIDEKNSTKTILEEAAQILSYKTAMGMSYYCSNKTLDNTIMETVDFLIRINSIFSALNPKKSTSKHNVNLFKGREFWCSCIDYIEFIIKAYPSSFTNQPMFPENLKMSMESVAFLSSVFYLTEHDSQLMFCLNQDPLIDFIDKMEINILTKRYPTTRELITSLNKGLIQNNYHNIEKIQDNSKLDNFIENAKKLLEENCVLEIPATKQVNREDYTRFHSKDAHSLCFISIYLLEKMYERFKNSLSSRIKQMSSSVVYENKYRKVLGSIIVPDNEFIDFVNSMDNIFVKNYKDAIANGKLFSELIEVFNKQFLTGPVDIAPLGYIKELFLKVRIYHTIKYNNKMLRKQTGDYQFVACKLI